MSVKWLRITLLIPLFFYGCSELLNFEPVVPDWETIFSFKMANEKIILGESIKGGQIDTLICDDPELCDSLRGRIFLFTQTELIEPTLVGDKLAMDDIQQSFSQNIADINIGEITQELETEIGIIDLGAMDPQNTPPFSFEDIVGTDYFNILEEAEGSLVTIDPRIIEPLTNQFSFSNFENAVIHSGEIKLEIFNNMFIYLGSPIIISLKDSNENIIGEPAEFDTIPPNTSESALINLIPGTTLPMIIDVEVSGQSVGTNGQNHLITSQDLESSFYVSVEIQSLSVTEAKAEIPSQTISDNSEIFLEQNTDDDDKVIISEATIKQGELSIQIENNTELGAELELTIHNIYRFGNEFTETLTFDGNGNASVLRQLDENYTLIMDPDSQKIEFSFEVITEDTSPDMIEINEENSFDVSISLSGETEGTGITFSTITGIFQKGIETSDQISIESGTKLLTAEIDTGSIILEIENNLNLEADVYFQLDEFLLGEDQLVQEFEITSGTNTPQIIDLSGYTIQFNEESLFSDGGQIINFSSNITMGEEEMTLNLEESLDINVEIKDLKFISITGILDTISVSDSMSISMPEYPTETTQLEGLALAKATITVDIFTEITVPVGIDLTLTGINSETGNEVVITNYFELEGNETSFPLNNTEQLINIFPNTINANIEAIIGGGSNPGSVSQNDTIQGVVYVEVPLAFEVQDSVRLELEPDSLGIIIEDISSIENINEITIQALLNNSLDLSIELMALIDEDTLFDNPDTLIDAFKITGGSIDTNQVVLDDYFFDLFTNDLYLKNIVTIYGKSDTAGNALPSVLYTTDSLELDIRGSIKFLLESNMEEE